MWEMTENPVILLSEICASGSQWWSIASACQEVMRTEQSRVENRHRSRLALFLFYNCLQNTGDLIWTPAQVFRSFFNDRNFPGFLYETAPHKRRFFM